MTPAQREAALRLADWLHASGVVNSEVKETIALLRELLAEPQGEPVACQYAQDVEMPEYRCVMKCQYAAQQQRKPLSDEQVLTAAGRLPGWLRHHEELDCDDLIDFARAIERAHRIGGKE